MPRDSLTTTPLDEANGRAGLDRLFPSLYDELHRLAAAQLRDERPDHTLGATALIHEAYLKLSRLDRLQWKNRSQFQAVAAQAMRRVLVNHAAARNASKRGGSRERLPLDEVVSMSKEDGAELIDLDRALTRLEAIDARQTQVVECRFFAGMTIEQTAEALSVAPATVKRDWALARAWLHRELSAPP